ncbi:MAG: hypothetical protein IPM71_08675 [Bacteroidota bacterium]|nr:MAG: hypothetical protein IPM71_08675 [Bacteroidota bacterium]
MVSLVAALDWGLGHTTRMLPLIGQLLDEGHEVLVTATPQQKSIYKEAFSNIIVLDIPSSGPVFSKRQNQLWSLLIYLPQFFVTIVLDGWRARKWVKQHHVERIISDNRYGFRSKLALNIIVTHQLNIIPPRALQWSNIVLKKLNSWAIDQFDECWVPDYSDNQMAGRLSERNADIKIPLLYLGILSRFKMVTAIQPANKPWVLILISGPEKQRTVFEQLMRSLVESSSKPSSCLIVRGLPDSAAPSFPFSINHCPAGLLKGLIENAEVIICRAGYTTLMDLECLRRRAILVPTPGQPEQEYLAAFHAQSGRHATILQKDLAGNSLEGLIKLLLPS